MADINAIGDDINFGDIPEEINALLQRGVAAYRSDHGAAEGLFQEALAAAPGQLPVYFCLYKIHTYQGNLDKALNVAEDAIKVAADQAGWSADWREWREWPVDLAPGGDAARFALYTLKALAFIRLRRDEKDRAVEALRVLEAVDPCGLVGWPVVAALADGVA